MVAVEASMIHWFNATFSGVQLPVNHFSLKERPDSTVKFMAQILKKEPGVLGYLVTIPAERAKVLKEFITDLYSYLEANPHGGHVHQLIKPAMMPSSCWINNNLHA